MLPSKIDYALAGAPLEADFYRSARSDAPLLVAMHGGAWIRGDRSQMAQWGRYLSARGVSVLAIDYSKATDGPSFPANLTNVRDAWFHARDNAAALGVDSARIGLLGASAGAHLAALAALTTDIDARVLVLAYGVYDLFAHCLADVAGEAPEDNPAIRMLGCAPHDDPALYFEASPQLQVTHARAAKLDVLMSWGGRDEVVRPSQSEHFAAVLCRAGARVTTDVIPQAGHFWFSKEPLDQPGSHAHALAPRLADFLTRAFA